LSFTFKEALRSQIDCDWRRILGLVLVAKTVANKVFILCYNKILLIQPQDQTGAGLSLEF
jgi:hypothetical protein